jgi:hypothetical protein
MRNFKSQVCPKCSIITQPRLKYRSEISVVMLGERTVIQNECIEVTCSACGYTDVVRCNDSKADLPVPRAAGDRGKCNKEPL